MSRDFRMRQIVRFGHVDQAGIAFYPRIFDYLHEAFEALWDDFVEVGYFHLIRERGIGFPLVRAEVDFRSPLRFGDRPEVRITCFHLGRSSLGLRYRYVVGERLALDARMTTACIDLATLKSREIPDEVRPAFRRILEVQ
jgi:YbgC/YbaW family acyl-CoA thioester hydrolase